MTASQGFPTLRLLRWRLDRHDISGMLPGDVRELKGF
jgi:16S rRNA U516 pseudouridylate synthase RsuA-like enzyme